MLEIPRGALQPPSAAQKLAAYQSAVDGEADFAACVKRAKKDWASKNRKTNAAFKHVRPRLEELCVVKKVCVYCEVSIADEVEHIEPKDWVPSRVFQWTNYVYACGPCNGPKSNRFGVVVGGVVQEQSRARGATPAPPPAAPSALINPRVEDPMSFLELDLGGTYEFLPSFGLGAGDRARAEFTLDVLHLNDREELVTGRRVAHVAFESMLEVYADAKDAQKPQAFLDRLRAGILGNSHSTVFREMVRQRARFGSLEQIFARVPEALTWLS